MERSRNLAMTGYMEMFGSEIARSREVSWQIFSQGEMFDIQELMFAIPEVSARNIREAEEKIFSTPMACLNIFQAQRFSLRSNQTVKNY